MAKTYLGTRNSVVIIGGLKEVPTVYETDDGHIATVNLATNYRTKKDGEYVDATEWHRVVVKNQGALFVQKYGRSGMRFLAEGWLRTRKVDDKENSDKADYYVTEIIAENFEPMDAFSKEEKKSEGKD